VAGNETFESWRERDHDDLVFAVALACWWADRDHRWVPVPKQPMPQSTWRERAAPYFGSTGSGRWRHRR
jgi:hypothetical protein